MKELNLLFENLYDFPPASVIPIAGGGSARKYYRLLSPPDKQPLSVIGVISHDTTENSIFFKMNEVLQDYSIKTPQVLAISTDKSSYLLQDLGDISLFNILKSPEAMELSRKALSELMKIQTIPEDAWKDRVSFSPFSARLVNWDLNYFKYDFLKPAGIPINEDYLEDDFEKLSDHLLSPDNITGLMYRDFQSRNIMFHDKELWFIDFQGARKGPLLYDAASFIWQAKAPFSFTQRETLGKFYCDNMASVFDKEPAKLYSGLQLMVLFRSLQVLGAYGFRGLIEGKRHFIDSIPFAIRNLKYLQSKGIIDPYPEINNIVDSLEEHKFLPLNSDDENLTVTVYSFSYKNGYPKDDSGNGGGFIFDCRGIHNPGRYPEYQNLTGLDKEVIDFLKLNSNALDFVENAVKIIRPSIDTYIKRGFTSLLVGFGCTGGRHRSVFCAQKFADTLQSMYPDIKVRIKHREQNLEF